jgi:hypothetical protein
MHSAHVRVRVVRDFHNTPQFSSSPIQFKEVGMKKRHWQFVLLGALIAVLMGCPGSPQKLGNNDPPGSGGGGGGDGGGTSKKPPVITTFTATPSSLSAAGSVELQWSVTGATSLFTLTAKNTDGAVTSTTDVTVGGPTTLEGGVWDQDNWNESLWQ